MSSSSIPSLDEWHSLRNDYWAMKYTTAAFLTILFYDHMITLDKEVETIWPLPWRFPKILFLINRYLIPPLMLVNVSVSLTFAPTSKSCLFVFRWIGFPVILALVTVELMLILRVLALYPHNKKVLVLLVVLFIGNIIGFLVIGVHLVHQMTETQSPDRQIFSGCRRTPPPLLYTEWIPSVVFESVVIILTLYKALAYRRYIPALRVLARDSMIYFSIMFSFLMLNVLFARVIRDSLRGMWVQPATLVSCLAVARMTLNIRKLSSDHEVTDNILCTGNFQTTRGCDTTICPTDTEITQRHLGGGENLDYTTGSDLGGKNADHTTNV